MLWHTVVVFHLQKDLCKHMHRRQNTTLLVLRWFFLCTMHLFCFHFSYGGSQPTCFCYFRLQCAILKQLRMLLMLLLQQCFLGYRFCLFPADFLSLQWQWYSGVKHLISFVSYEVNVQNLAPILLHVAQYYVLWYIS